jgi:Right handed beta helix region
MPVSNLSTPCIAARLIARPLPALTAACLVHGVVHAATLPTAPKTFQTTYAAQTGATLTVAAGGDLRAALDKAQLGDTIVLEAGATWTGPFKLPNKPAGSGWIYVVSNRLSNLPPPGTRVSPANAASMPKILAPNGGSALVTEANSHHFRFVGIEFAPVSGSKLVYQVVTIGNKDTSPATLPSYIVFDRCYVHGDPAESRRGIEMDGAYVAVVDSYISHFQQEGIDSQGLWAYNTTGPLQIRNNYIEAATENVLFGGADARAAELVPADIEVSNNHLFKQLSLMPSKKYPMKNLLEFKAAQRVAVTGNTFENNPAHAQSGFAILITPRNQNGNAPWSVTSDIAITGNTLINVGSGFNIAGLDNFHQTGLTERILLRNNLVGVTGLNGADGRAFQFLAAGGDYTVDHNTVINTALPPATPASALTLAEAKRSMINNFVFTNNLSTRTRYGFFGSGVGEGTPALNKYFTNWTFSKNVLIDGPAAQYPAGNFFPTGVAAVRFLNYAGGNYALAADSPYKNAGTDGTDIGASGAPAANLNAELPNPPTNVSVK